MAQKSLSYRWPTKERSETSRPALTIGELYRLRWQVELFFKWIKQHLHIKTFFGTSDNAVRTQIRIATSVYLLVAIAGNASGSAFEKAPLAQVLSGPDYTPEIGAIRNQLSLFDL